jgi:hypothetical protein
MFLFFLCFQQTVYASHDMGADISYRCLGNNQYEVKLTFYRDCNGIDAPTSVTINVSSQSCGQALNVTIPQDPGSGQEVSPLCPSQIVNSTCNSGSLPGIRLYTYTGIVTIPAQCTDWTFTWDDCCRNDLITNIPNASGLGMQVVATLNNSTILCNNSPTFTTPPVPYICAGQRFNYNHGALDVDGDSLVFALVAPLDDAGNPITYGAGFSPTYPISTAPPNNFIFDPETGQMTFTPSVAQVSVVAVVVSEYRNGVLIGTTRRDMQIVVLGTCNNDVPSFGTGANGLVAPFNVTGGTFNGRNAFQVCQGTTLTFLIGASDPNIADSLDVLATNITQSIPGSFIVRQLRLGQAANGGDSLIVGFFIPTANVNPGVHSFTLSISDNHCPIPGIQIVGFDIIVPGVQIYTRDTTLCPGITQTIQLNASVYGDTTGVFTWSPSTGLSNPNSPRPFLTIPSTATGNLVYSVTYVTQGCTVTDNVTIRLNPNNLNLNVNLTASDTIVCNNGLNQAINLNTTVSGNGSLPTGGIYTWTPSTYLSNTSIPNPIANLNSSNLTSITYRVNYAYGACTGSDSVTIRLNAGSVTATPSLDTICQGQSVQLNTSASYIAKDVVCGYSSLPCQNSQTTQQVGTGTVSTSSTPTPYRGFWEDGKVQLLYTASDLNAQGVQRRITAFALDIASKQSSLPYSNFTIKIGCTNKSALGTTSFEQGLVPVYTSAAHTPIVGWNTYNFSQAFLWDGTSNLVIEICFDNADWSSYDLVRYSTVAYNAVNYQDADGSTGCSFSSPEATSTLLPNARFTSCNPTPPLTYTWTPALGLSSSTIPNPVATPPVTTSYIVEVSDGKCPIKDTVTIVIGGDLLAPVMSCGTATPNSVTFTWLPVAGATGYEVSIDGGATFISPNGAGGLSHTVGGLLSGQAATIIVRPIGGSGTCGNFSAQLSCNALTCMILTPQVTNVSCNGGTNGQVIINTAQGISPYTYTLSGRPTQPSNTFTGLSVGTYTVTVTDNGGCTDTTTFVLTQPAPINTTTTASIVTCELNGTATVTATGGANPYTYLWANGQTTATATGLRAGSYVVTITDNNGCQTTNTATVLFQGPTLVARQNDTICAGDTIQLNAVYTPFNAPAPSCKPNSTSVCLGNSYLATVGTGTSVTSNNRGTPYAGFNSDNRVQMLYLASELTAAGLNAGLIRELAFNISNKASTQPYTNFKVSIGCTNLTAMTNTFVGGLSTVLNTTVTTATGWNTHTFTTPYEWDGLSNLIVEVCYDNTTANLTDNVFFTTTPFVSTVSAENSASTGCIATPERANVNRPNIRFNACMIFPPYDFSWTPSTSILYDSIPNPLVFPTTTTDYIVSVMEGTCTISDTVTITVINPAATIPTVTCGTSTNNSITINWTGVAGATGYRISIDGTTWTSVGNVLTYTQTGLLSGTPTTFGVQAEGLNSPCVGVGIVTCNTTSCALTATTTAITNVSCNGQSNGSATVTVANSTGAVNYTITPAVVGTQTNGNYTNLPAGSYSVFVEDSRGCSDTTNFSITVPTGIIDTIVHTNPTCTNLCNGTATVNLLGSVGN